MGKFGLCRLGKVMLCGALSLHDPSQFAGDVSVSGLVFEGEFTVASPTGCH